MSVVIPTCTSKQNVAVQTCKAEKQNAENCALQYLVNQYWDKFKNAYVEEDKWWSNQSLTWEEALERAWKSRLWYGKMHDHQRLVAPHLPEGLEIALKDKKKPEDFQDFHSVYVWVESVTGRVKGLGVLTTYDVARRLGVWLKLEPTQVYLHAGSAAGARKLGIRGESVPLSEFPKEIRELGATHAENFLCIYKDQF